ncbi:MAG: hypothetical protein VB958_00380 [Thalassolituus sp.]|uniref:hypothetical protein n=1 Tax=Thalassolituus sp. TaxID=2030822 RepID=UPI003981CDE4
MIEFKYEKEKQIALYIANSLADQKALSILECGTVKNSDEALHLAQFYWRAVDELIKLSDSKIEICNESNLQEWSEHLFNTFRSYLKRSGYSAEWAQASESA